MAACQRLGHEAEYRGRVEAGMKIQKVILGAMARRITWWQAAEITGISCRQLRRSRRRYEEDGYDGLRDRLRGRVSEKRVPLGTMEAVLRLFQEQYFDFDVRHFHGIILLGIRLRSIVLDLTA